MHYFLIFFSSPKVKGVYYIYMKTMQLTFLSHYIQDDMTKSKLYL